MKMTASEDTVAPDGRWKWMVLAGSFYITANMICIMMVFGILFRDLMTEMGVSSTNLAWILNLHACIWFLSSMFTTPLCTHLGWRAVAFTGSLITSVAFMFMAFALSPGYILLLFSIVIGIAGGASANVPFIVVPHYFQKLRGMAIGVVMTGTSIGLILFPLLIRTLQDEYGFFGATIIHGSIILNCCVASALFRPLKRNQIMRKNKGFDGLLTVPNNTNNSGPLKTQKNTFLSVNNCAMRGYITIIAIIKSTISNFKAIKNLPLLIILFSLSFHMTGYINFLVQVPFAMQFFGYSLRETSWCVSIAAIGNTVSRIIITCVSDRSWFSRKKCFIFGAVLTSFCTAAFAVVMAWEVLWLEVVLGVWGVGAGAHLSVFHALLIDTVGLKLYESGVTVLGLLLAITCITIGPALGLLRDVTGSYAWSIGACSALKLLAALVWLLMPLAEARQANKTAHAVAQTSPPSPYDAEAHPVTTTLQTNELNGAQAAPVATT